MRSILHIVLAALVIAGLQRHVWAEAAHDAIDHCLGHQHEHTGCDHDSRGQTAPSEGQSCPQDHHHQDCHTCVMCSHHWIDAKDSSFSPKSGITKLLRIRHECQLAPDSPVLSEDKPPLI